MKISLCSTQMTLLALFALQPRHESLTSSLQVRPSYQYSQHHQHHRQQQFLRQLPANESHKNQDPQRTSQHPPASQSYVLSSPACKQHKRYARPRTSDPLEFNYNNATMMLASSQTPAHAESSTNNISRTLSYLIEKQNPRADKITTGQLSESGPGCTTSELTATAMVSLVRLVLVILICVLLVKLRAPMGQKSRLRARDDEEKASTAQVITENDEQVAAARTTESSFNFRKLINFTSQFCGGHQKIFDTATGTSRKPQRRKSQPELGSNLARGSSNSAERRRRHSDTSLAHLKLPPGPMGLPFLGYLPFVGSEIHLTLTSLSESYGPIYQIFLGGIRVVVLNEAALVRQAFKQPVFSGRPDTQLTRILQGYGIVNSEGALWKEQRAFLHSALRKLGAKSLMNGSNGLEAKIQYRYPAVALIIIYARPQNGANRRTRPTRKQQALTSCANQLSELFSHEFKWNINPHFRFPESRNISQPPTCCVNSSTAKFGNNNTNERMQNQVREFVTDLSGHANQGKACQVRPIVARAVSSVVGSIVMNLTYRKYEEKEKFDRLIELMQEGFRLFTIAMPLDFIPIFRFLPGVSYAYKKMKRNRAETSAFFQGVADEHRRYLSNTFNLGASSSTSSLHPRSMSGLAAAAQAISSAGQQQQTTGLNQPAPTGALQPAVTTLNGEVSELQAGAAHVDSSRSSTGQQVSSTITVGGTNGRQADNNGPAELENIVARDLVDAYLVQQKKHENDGKENYFSDQQLVQIMSDIFSAGLETVTSTIEWSILFLILNTHCQEKVHEEIDRVIGRERSPQLDDLAHMPYTEATIYEVLRRSNVVALGNAHATLADASIAGYLIPKGTQVLPNLYGIHMSPKLWDQPDRFDPTRFIVNERAHKPDYFMPFSVGRRMCLGDVLTKMEVFLFLVGLLQKYNLSVAEEDRDCPPQVKGTIGVSNAPVSFKVALTWRCGDAKQAKQEAGDNTSDCQTGNGA